MPSDRIDPPNDSPDEIENQCPAAVVMECELPAGHRGPHLIHGHGPMTWVTDAE